MKSFSSFHPAAVFTRFEIATELIRTTRIRMRTLWKQFWICNSAPAECKMMMMMLLLLCSMTMAQCEQEDTCYHTAGSQRGQTRPPSPSQTKRYPLNTERSQLKIITTIIKRFSGSGPQIISESDTEHKSTEIVLLVLLCSFQIMGGFW